MTIRLFIGIVIHNTHNFYFFTYMIFIQVCHIRPRNNVQDYSYTHENYKMGLEGYYQLQCYVMVSRMKTKLLKLTFVISAFAFNQDFIM